MFKFSQNSYKKLAQVNKKLIALAEEVLKRSKYDFGISSGFRTRREQMALYAKGRTQPGDIVTKCNGRDKRSKHQFGLAIDIFIYDENGKVTWDPLYFKYVADIFKKVEKEEQEFHNIVLKWGGDFRSFKDYPHFEIKILPIYE